MNQQHLALLCLISLLTMSCDKGVSVNQPQPSKGTVAQVTQTPVSETVANPAKELATVRSGTFVPGEHSTEGMVRIVTKNSKFYLELDRAFKTSEMGPDLVVILHRSEDVIGSTQPPAYSLNEGDYEIIAPLKKFSGAQSYPIPDTIELDDYKSAAIWCRKFNATFGAANLSR